MERTWKPTTAGILTIIEGAGRIALGTGVIIVGKLVGALSGLDWSSRIEEWARMYGRGALGLHPMLTRILDMSSTALIAVGAVLLAFGIVALVGGINALKRKRWGLALAGSILSLPGVLGVLAIIFVSLGKKEFD
jgi:hypothetical protein